MEIKLPKIWTMILGVALLAAPVIAQQKPPVKTLQEKPALQTLKDRESYAMGVEMLRNLKRQGFDFNLDAVIMGMKDAFAGDKLAMSDEEMLESLNILGSMWREQRVSDQLIAGRDNKKAEEDFLAQNRMKPGVVTLPTGLQYKIIKDGNDKKPTADDTVEVDYRGTLVDGTQ